MCVVPDSTIVDIKGFEGTIDTHKGEIQLYPFLIKKIVENRHLF